MRITHDGVYLLMMVSIYFVDIETVLEVEEEVDCNGVISSVPIEHRISSSMISSILCVNVPVSKG